VWGQRDAFRPTLSMGHLPLAEWRQRLGDEGVGRLTRVYFDIARLAGVEQGAYLLQHLEPSGRQSHDDPPTIRTPPP